MNKQIIIVGLVAALAACNKESHTIVESGPGDERNASADANVVLPPSIVSSKVYRCADNVIVHVDWLSDGKSATLRTDKAGTPTTVTAEEAGKAMIAEGGYSLDGSAQGDSARIGVPGHSSQSCKA
ncbi:MAG: hypothetical protein ABIR63_03500 [Sphingomicrobium sp.]